MVAEAGRWTDPPALKVPPGESPKKESQEGDPAIEPQGEVSRSAAQPERNFWGEEPDLMEAYEAVCCGAGVRPLGKHLESASQLFSTKYRG